MNKKILITLLFFIIIVAASLRLYRLGEVPSSPDWDEAALGYNAYSIMLTGRDEYGEFFPLILRSFDDYKPGLYTYVIIPFIKVFGLNEFAVRLPSAIFGIFTVILTFLVVRILFHQNGIRRMGGWIDADKISLFSSGLLAISPWHIQFSRIAFESNVGLALNLFVVFFFLIGLKRPWFIFFSFLLGGFNIYMYQSEKVFTPLLLLSLIIIYHNKVFKIGKKWIILSFAIVLLVSFPMLLSLFTNQQALLRAKGVSVFSDQTQFLKRNAEKLVVDRDANDYVGKVVDNRRFEYAKAIISGYIAHFDLNWLFITGDLPRHHAPYMGLMYLFELPFLLIGIYKLIFGNFEKKSKLVIFSIFLLAPIPASITSGVPHAIRTLNFLPTFQIFTAIGVITAISAISNIPPSLKLWRASKYFKFFIVVFIFSFFVFNFLYYLNQYFVQQNYFYSQAWQYGYKEAIEEVKKIEGNYDKIIVSNQPHLDQSYIFFLFYMKYPPTIYQNQTQNVSGGFAENHYFGKFEFRPIIWEKEKKEGRTLYVGRPNDFPSGVGVIKKINFLDEKVAIIIVKG